MLPRRPMAPMIMKSKQGSEWRVSLVESGERWFDDEPWTIDIVVFIDRRVLRLGVQWNTGEVMMIGIKCWHVFLDQKGLARLPSASPSPPANITNTLFSVFFVVYLPLNDSFTNITLLHFLYLSRRSLRCRGFYIYLLIVIQILFSFLSLNRNRSKCLIYWLASPYRIKYSLLTTQNSHEYIHSYNPSIPFSSNELLSSLKIHPTDIKLSQGWFYTHDCTLQFTFETRNWYLSRPDTNV